MVSSNHKAQFGRQFKDSENSQFKRICWPSDLTAPLSQDVEFRRLRLSFITNENMKTNICQK